MKGFMELKQAIIPVFRLSASDPHLPCPDEVLVVSVIILQHVPTIFSVILSSMLKPLAANSRSLLDILLYKASDALKRRTDGKDVNIGAATNLHFKSQNSPERSSVPSKLLTLFSISLGLKVKAIGEESLNKTSVMAHSKP
ncbi:hypothetical protein Tco_0428333 [Tanacetum coccineum]